MFPIRDENPTVHTSLTTFLLIGINIVVWIWVHARQGDLFEDTRTLAKKDALRTAVADINARYGRACILTATELVLEKNKEGRSRGHVQTRELGIPDIGTLG